jgi:hypothetical protein
MMRLTGHWPETADLPVQPLQHGITSVLVARQEATGLVGEILQDRARLEDRERPPGASSSTIAESCCSG